MSDLFWRYWPSSADRFIVNDVRFWFPGGGGPDGMVNGWEILIKPEFAHEVPLHPRRITISYSWFWWYVRVEHENDDKLKYPRYFSFLRTLFTPMPHPRTIMRWICKELLEDNHSYELFLAGNLTSSEKVTPELCRHYASGL